MARTAYADALANKIGRLEGVARAAFDAFPRSKLFKPIFKRVAAIAAIRVGPKGELDV